MAKIVINACYGGFGISLAAAEYMAERGHKQARAELKKYEADKNNTEDRHGIFGPWHGYGYVEGFRNGYKRNDPLLVEAVEKLGEHASGHCANLKVVKIPNSVKWTIEEYDGQEWVAEKHRTWP